MSGFAHDGGEDLSCLVACVRLYGEISKRVECIKTRKNVTPTLLLGACTLTSLQYLMQGSLDRFADYLEVSEDLLPQLNRVDFPDLL